MGFLFNELVYRPIYNLLILIYNLVPLHDFGIAIVLVTILIKLLLVPLSRKQIESQRKMQEMQPKIKEIQDKYKHDKEKQSRALMEFYKENKANPFSGCLPMVFQLVFLIAIYRVLYNISKDGLMVSSIDLYPFLHNPGAINHYFLGIIDLSSIVSFQAWTVANVAHILLVVAAAAAQYFQTKLMMETKAKKETAQEKEKKKKKAGEADFAQVMSKQMLFLAPMMTLFIGFKFQAGLALYWLVSTLFMIAQQENWMDKLKSKTVKL